MVAVQWEHRVIALRPLTTTCSMHQPPALSVKRVIDHSAGLGPFAERKRAIVCLCRRSRYCSRSTPLSRQALRARPSAAFGTGYSRFSPLLALPERMVPQKSAACELALGSNFLTLGTNQDSNCFPPPTGPVRTLLTTGHHPSAYRRTWIPDERTLRRPPGHQSRPSATLSDMRLA